MKSVSRSLQLIKSRSAISLTCGALLSTSALFSASAFAEDSSTATQEASPAAMNEPAKIQPLPLNELRKFTDIFGTIKNAYVEEIDDAIYADKPQFSYVCNVIDRADGQIKLFDLRSTIYSQIVDYATNPDYGNPSDDDSGYDLTIKKEKTGPLPQNVKYTCIPARNNAALTEAEKGLELFDLSKIYKRQT